MNTDEVIGYKHSARYGTWTEITRKKAHQVEKAIPSLQRHAFKEENPRKSLPPLRNVYKKKMVQSTWANAWRSNNQTQKLFSNPKHLKRYAQSHGFLATETNEINQHYINTICGRPNK